MSKPFRDKRLAAGFCVECGLAPHRPDRKTCQPCADIAAVRNEASLAKARAGLRAKRITVDDETAGEACRVSPGARCFCLLLLPCADHCALTARFYAEHRRDAA